MALIRPGTVQVKLPEIGRIFKGGPKRENPKNPSGASIMGIDLDHFRFEPSPSTYDLPSPDGNGRLADYLIRQYKELGDAPRALPIQFLHAEIDKDFSAINEVWAKIGGVERCVRRCDGQDQKLHLVESGGKKMLSDKPIPCAATEGMNRCPMDCKPTGRLSFVMPCLNYPGLVIMTTHSIYDIIEIQGNLAMYSNWDINKIPFQLCRAEKTINRTNDDGSKTPMKKWLCHLVIDPRFGNAVLAAQPKQYLAELTGGIEWDADYVSVEPVHELAPAIETKALEAASVTPEAKSTRNWTPIKEWTAVSSEQIKSLAMAREFPAKPSELTVEQSDILFRNVLAQWAFNQYPAVFNAFPHALNAVNKLANALGAISDQEIWDAWSFECSERATKKAEPAPSLD